MGGGSSKNNSNKSTSSLPIDTQKNIDTHGFCINSMNSKSNIVERKPKRKFSKEFETFVVHNKPDNHNNEDFSRHIHDKTLANVLRSSQIYSEPSEFPKLNTKSNSIQSAEKSLRISDGNHSSKVSSRKNSTSVNRINPNDNSTNVSTNPELLKSILSDSFLVVSENVTDDISTSITNSSK